MEQSSDEEQKIDKHVQESDDEGWRMHYYNMEKFAVFFKGCNWQAVRDDMGEKNATKIQMWYRSLKVLLTKKSIDSFDINVKVLNQSSIQPFVFNVSDDNSVEDIKKMIEDTTEAKPDGYDLVYNAKKLTYTTLKLWTLGIKNNDNKTLYVVSLN